jgi:hypothetical protein
MKRRTSLAGWKRLRLPRSAGRIPFRQGTDDLPHVSDAPCDLRSRQELVHGSGILSREFQQPLAKQVKGTDAVHRLLRLD